MSVLLTLALAWLLQVMLPGPNAVMVTQQAVRRGRRSALITVLGISCGAAIWATSAMVGFAAVLARSATLLQALRIVGGVVIVWFGVRLIRGSRQREVETVVVPPPPESCGQSFLGGVMTSLSNPKTAVYFVSLFVTLLPAEIETSLGFLIVGTITSISVAWYGLLAVLLSGERIQSGYRRMSQAFDAVAGGVLVLFGVRLVATSGSRS